MKIKIYSIFIFVSFFSCENSNKETIKKDKFKIDGSTINNEKKHMKIHEEMDKVSFELIKFDMQLLNLYKKAEKNPKKVLKEADSLIVITQSERDPIKSKIKKNITHYLHYLKGELYYKLGDYHKSIYEINLSSEHSASGDKAIALAANYIKLKQFKKAKSYLKSIGVYDTNDYAHGNYYECIGNKKEATKIYNIIKADKSIKHYAYYKWTIVRLEELKKKNPKLLKDLYFPTGNPDFEICDSDNENRDKIFQYFINLPEVIMCGSNCNSTWIYESPQENDKDFYWVKIGNGNTDNTFNTKFDFFVYPKSFEVKFYDTKNKKLYTLKEWRKKATAHSLLP